MFCCDRPPGLFVWGLRPAKGNENWAFGHRLLSKAWTGFSTLSFAVSLAFFSSLLGPARTGFQRAAGYQPAPRVTHTLFRSQLRPSLILLGNRRSRAPNSIGERDRLGDNAAGAPLNRKWLREHKLASEGGIGRVLIVRTENAIHGNVEL
jgi:hypothetical protein